MLQWLKYLFAVNWLDVLGILWQVAGRIVPFLVRAGLYEVLDYEACLELKDVKGRKAVYSKRQRVRFLQNRVVAIQDQAWGDGEIFASYKCSPGVAVDRYREGNRWRILISLRETKNRGDEEEFYVERTIRDGFTKRVEEFQIDIDHWTRQTAVKVIFPRDRSPRRVTLIEQNRKRTTPLRNITTLPDGRYQVEWEMRNPRLHESYIVRWSW